MVATSHLMKHFTVRTITVIIVQQLAMIFFMPGDHMWGEYAVRFFPTRFAVSVVLWLIAVFIVFKVVRFLSRRHYVA